jgi:hypothetical protein
MEAEQAIDRALRVSDILYLLAHHTSEWDVRSTYAGCLVSKAWAVPFIPLLWHRHGHIVYLCMLLHPSGNRVQSENLATKWGRPSIPAPVPPPPTPALVKRVYVLASYLTTLTDERPALIRGATDIHLPLAIMQFLKCIAPGRSVDDLLCANPPLFPAIHTLAFAATGGANQTTTSGDYALHSELGVMFRSLDPGSLKVLRLANGSCGASLDALELIRARFINLEDLQLHLPHAVFEDDESRAVTILPVLISRLRRLRRLDIAWHWAFPVGILVSMGRLAHLKTFKLKNAHFLPVFSPINQTDDDDESMLSTPQALASWSNGQDLWFPNLRKLDLIVSVAHRIHPLRFLGNRISRLDITIRTCITPDFDCATTFHRPFFKMLSDFGSLSRLRIDLSTKTKANCSGFTSEDFHQLKTLNHLEDLRIKDNEDFDLTVQDLVEVSSAWSQMRTLYIGGSQSKCPIEDDTGPCWESASPSELAEISPHRRDPRYRSSHGIRWVLDYPDTQEVPLRFWNNMPDLSHFFMAVGPWRFAPGEPHLRWCMFDLARGYCRLRPVETM